MKPTLLLGLVVAALLTQCGGEQPDQAQASPPADTPSTVEASSPATAQDPAARAAELTVKKVNGTATEAEIQELERYISGE